MTDPSELPPTPPARAPTDATLRPDVFIARRRARLEKLLQHSLVPPRESGVSADSRRFLLEEAIELYWNELEWEKLTAEEMSEGGSELVEMAFPGFLAFVDALLLKETNRDSKVPASPRPEVVGDILLFLGGRCLELIAAKEAERQLERAMTGRLVDLVLYRLHGLPVDGVDQIEVARRREEEG